MIERIRPKGIFKRYGGILKKENLVGLLYTSIPVIGVLLFMLVPVILSIFLCFTSWSGYNTIFSADIVGFRNFKDLFVGVYSKEFLGSMLNTLILMLSVPIGMVLSLLLALALNRKMMGSNVFRIIYYIPCITNVVAVTIIFNQLFYSDGAMNQLLGFLGIPAVSWLFEPMASRAVIILLLVWKGLGYTTLLYLAGLQGVSREYYEAAKLDGANGFQMFIKITVPLIQPMTFFLLVTGIMSGLQIYTEPSIMFPFNFGKGPELSTQTIMVFLYYNFSKIDQLGVASAVAWVLTIIIFIVTAIQFYINGRRDKV